MTSNTNLLPGQLVDVEYRVIGPKLTGWRSIEAEVRRITYQRLQSRKLLKNDSGELSWTDWADVPVVEEG